MLALSDACLLAVSGAETDPLSELVPLCPFSFPSPFLPMKCNFTHTRLESHTTKQTHVATMTTRPTMPPAVPAPMATVDDAPPPILSLLAFSVVGRLLPSLPVGEVPAGWPVPSPSLLSGRLLTFPAGELAGWSFPPLSKLVSGLIQGPAVGVSIIEIILFAYYV